MPPDDFDEIERRFASAPSAPTASSFDEIEASFGIGAFTDDEKIAYMKRLYPGQDVDPGSEVLSVPEQEAIYAKYKAEPWNVAPDALSPEFTRRTTLAAFDKAFGGRSRADVDAAMDRHAPKVTTGEQAQFVTGQVVSGMNAPALGYARRLFGPGGVLENPDSMAAAENVADPSRASLGDRYARVRADMESTAAKRTLVAGAHLAGATPGLILSGKALATPGTASAVDPALRMVPAMGAGPAVLGLNALASSGGDVAAAGEGVAFGALAGMVSLPLQRLISRFPPAMQSALVDRAMTMGAGGAEFFTADAILHGPEGERGAANFLFGMLMKAAGATPGQTRAKELTTSTATYPDPVRAAAEVRGGYDRALAEAEASKAAVPAIDPVAEARATAAQFDARVAPESVAPEKPVSVAPVAPVEAPKSPAPEVSPEAALRSMSRKVPASMGGGSTPDPIAADILKSPAVLAEIPAGSRPIGSGFSAVVLETPSGDVVRIGRGQPRPNVPEVLQPTSSMVVDGWIVERLPKVDAAGITGADVDAMTASLRRQGYEFSDAGIDNLGRLPDGRVVVVDSGAVTRSTAAATPEAPKSKTLVGTDKQGKQVWEIAGRYYVKDKAGRYGTAHPEAVKEARANAALPVEAAPVEAPRAEPVATREVAPATPNVAAPEAPTAEPRPGKAAESTYGSKNTIVTKENYEAAKASLKAKLGQTRLSMGIDPTVLADLVKMGTYHVESGARDFISWARIMVQDYGDAVRPHLRSVWEESQAKGRLSESEWQSTPPTQNIKSRMYGDPFMDPEYAPPGSLKENLQNEQKAKRKAESEAAWAESDAEMDAKRAKQEPPKGWDFVGGWDEIPKNAADLKRMVGSQGVRIRGVESVKDFVDENGNRHQIVIDEPSGQTILQRMDERGLWSDVTSWDSKGRVPTEAALMTGLLREIRPKGKSMDEPIGEPAATPDVAMATPDVAAPEAIKTLTRGGAAATEMFAGGPEVISAKAHSIWTGLRDTVAEGAKALRTFFSSQKSPELLAESPKAWRHVVAADAAPSIAKEAFGVWKSEVPDKAWSPQDAAKFEAALTENNRLGAIDARRADAARKIDEAKALRSEAAKMGALQGEGRSLALARATTMVKSALRLEREAKVLNERAYRAESKDEYLYGPGKPFTSRQELQEFVTRPDVVEAAKRHAEWWKEMVEPRYKASIQADDSVAMPGRGRFFDARASLVAERGESPVGGAGLVAGRTENLRVRKSRFAKTAFGDAAQGYKTAAEDYIPTALTDVIPKGEWRAAIDTLVKEGKATVVKPGQKPPEEIGGEKAMPFDIGPGKDPVYMPKRLHDMLYRIRQTGVKKSIPVITAVANKATSEALSMALDNIFHIFRSMGVTMTRPSSGNPLREAALETVAWPVMRLLDGARLVRRVFKGMDQRGRLEMAESGVAERGDSYRRDPKTGEVMIGPDGKPLPMESNIYGLRWLGKLGDAMDRAGRQELFDVIRRMKAAGVNIDDSPEAISRFVGQMGRYGRAWYGPTQRWVSDTGLNRFFEAWRNARGNAGRTLSLESALTPKDAKTAKKLRLVMLSKLAGMFTTAGIINTLTDGSPFGKSDVPVGAIVLKRDEKTGRATTLDFFKMFGIRQVMNALGITAAIDAARTGGTVEQAATNAKRAFGAELTRPFSGPLPTAVSIWLTGSRPDQVARNQGDAMVPASATEGGLLRRQTVEATKALFPLHAAVAETGARALGLDQIRDILNIGEEVTPDMVDEMSEMLRTFSVGRTIGADKTDSLPERSKMGYLFGTYVDAVKEDIRKAPPEKIEAVMSKAFADIEARDDLDNGTKARLKKVIQMYAIGRQKGR